MVGRMKIPDDTNNIDSRLNEDTDTTSKGNTKTAAAASLDNLIPNGSDYPTSGRSSPNVPKYKEELEELRKKSEQEQMKRIKKRQQVYLYYLFSFKMFFFVKFNLTIFFKPLVLAGMGEGKIAYARR